jgi:hypothetical protein
VRVVNIAEPVELHEIAPRKSNNWTGVAEEYETALTEFESGRYQNAISSLGNLLAAHQNDGPSLVLLERAVQAALGRSSPGGVWDLPSK